MFKKLWICSFSSGSYLQLEELRIRILFTRFGASHHCTEASVPSDTPPVPKDTPLSSLFAIAIRLECKCRNLEAHNSVHTRIYTYVHICIHVYIPLLPRSIIFPAFSMYAIPSKPYHHTTTEGRFPTFRQPSRSCVLSTSWVQLNKQSH